MFSPSMSNSSEILSLPAAHMRLFQREILKLMTDKEFQIFLSFLTYAQQEKLFVLWNEKETCLSAKRLAFKLFSFIPESTQYFQIIINRSGKNFFFNLIF